MLFSEIRNNDLHAERRVQSSELSAKIYPRNKINIGAILPAVIASTCRVLSRGSFARRTVIEQKLFSMNRS